MATPSRGTSHYHLPARIRADIAFDNSFSSRMALVDRISGMAGIHTVESAADTLPFRVQIYLQEPSASVRREHPLLLLCTLAADGIEIYGLSQWDRHQVLRGGWGRLRRDHVFFYPPRNNEELEVCWGVMQRAYQHLSDLSAKGPLARKSLLWNLPRVSRTALQ